MARGIRPVGPGSVIFIRSVPVLGKCGMPNGAIGNHHRAGELAAQRLDLGAMEAERDAVSEQAHAEAGERVRGGSRPGTRACAGAAQLEESAWVARQEATRAHATWKAIAGTRVFPCLSG